METEDSISRIEAGLASLHRALFQHKNWENLKSEAGITLDRPEAALLKALEHNKVPCQMQQIADQLGVEAPSISRTSKGLEEAGLIKKSVDKTDGRVNNIRLTAEGRKQLKRLHSVRRNQLKKVFDGWTPADREKLASLLNKMADGVTRTINK